jgi:molecular chaperone GrpE
MPAGKNAPRAERNAHAKEEPELKETKMEETCECKGSDAQNDVGKACDGRKAEKAADGEIEELKKRLAEAKSESESFKDEAARAKADFYNYRTRIERDRARDRILAAEGAVDALLPVLDNLDRTLQAVSDKDSQLFKGVSMVQRQFFGALQNLGLKVIDTDCQFDPSQHEALMVIDVEDKDQDGKILEELHKGYKLGDKVLRAAQVKIGRKH